MAASVQTRKIKYKLQILHIRWCKMVINVYLHEILVRGRKISILLLYQAHTIFGRQFLLKLQGLFASCWIF